MQTEVQKIETFYQNARFHRERGDDRAADYWLDLALKAEGRSK